MTRNKKTYLTHAHPQTCCYLSSCFIPYHNSYFEGIMYQQNGWFTFIWSGRRTTLRPKAADRISAQNSISFTPFWPDTHIPLSYTAGPNILDHANVLIRPSVMILSICTRMHKNSPCTNYARRHKNVWADGYKTPCILKLDTRWGWASSGRDTSLSIPGTEKYLPTEVVPTWWRKEFLPLSQFDR
jgi:hypothetical protein